MSRRLDRGACARLRWTYRRSESLRKAKNLIQRGLRPQVVSELTGIEAKLCMELRREILPEGPPVRSSVPYGVEARRMRTEQVYQAGSVFVAAYLAAAGAERASRNFEIDAWCTAFDLSQEVCERVGWEPLSADYAYVIAREMTNPEQLVYEWCAICGAAYYGHHNAHHRCPFCRELEGRRPRDKRQPTIEITHQLHATG